MIKMILEGKSKKIKDFIKIFQSLPNLKMYQEIEPIHKNPDDKGESRSVHLFDCHPIKRRPARVSFDTDRGTRLEFLFRDLTVIEMGKKMYYIHGKTSDVVEIKNVERS